MSGIVHQSSSRGPLHTLLRAVCIAAPITALIVYSQRDARPAPTPVATVTATTAATLPSATAPQPKQAATAAPLPMKALAPVATEQARPDAPAKEFADRNAAIDVRLLTSSQPATARAFLNEVVVTPGPKGGFVVAEVLADSRYDRLGVRPGDLIYSLDSPGTPTVDESSIIALTSRSEIHLDVYRNGTLVHLRHNLASPAEADHAAGH